MTRLEFEEEVTTWYDLEDFCREIDCDIANHVMSQDDRDEWINDELVDLARNSTWREMYDTLAEYDRQDGYDYYLYDSYYGEMRGVDDADFDDYKERVMDYAERNGEFDPEEEEEEPEEPEEETVFTEENTLPAPEEDCSLDDMFSDAMVA